MAPSRPWSSGCVILGRHLLPAVPYLPALAAGFACDERDNHRQPIDHYWRLFDDTLSDTARLAATAADYSDFSRRLRPDLCGLDQLVTDARHAWHYGRFRKVRQSHIRLRHRRLGDDADDLGTLVHRYARDWGWSLVTAGAIPDVFMLVHAGSSKRDLSPGVYQGLDFPMRNSVSSRASPPPWRGAWEKVAPAA
jgi:hypothetical protein